jgi:hypothetical protein
MICGHCHGQRVPEPTDRIQTILTSGDPYNAGDDLRQFYRPISQTTKIGTVSLLIASGRTVVHDSLHTNIKSTAIEVLH